MIPAKLLDSLAGEGDFYSMSPLLMEGIALLCFLLGIAFSSSSGRAEVRAISTNTIHLGIAGKPEWDFFKGTSPEGQKLALQFRAVANASPSTLLIRQDDVKQGWRVSLNGTNIGSLFQMEADLWQALPIPTGLLRSGSNKLEIQSKTPEDILIRRIELADLPMQEVLGECEVKVEVRDSESHELLPARITLVDSNGSFAAVTGFSSTNLAVRPGVVYTGDGSARLGVRAGEYKIYATRGPEYSVAERTVVIKRGGNGGIELEISRGVDTKGWVACDTHIHSLTFSHHGDATAEERVITLGGEGLELPVITEHNQHANYSPALLKVGLGKYMTVVNGNEVTTARGHFNIFPVELSAAPPNYKLTNWSELITAMRAVPGVEVITLNHPTDSHNGFTPFDATHFNRVTGKNSAGLDYGFDAMEIINSGAMRSDWFEPFRCWFALLNRGFKVTGVAGSDSHDVSQFIVGQGRTYIEVADAIPGAIDIHKACESLRAGRAVASLGLFSRIEVNAKAGPGDLITVAGESIKIRGRVECADWMHPERVDLYANGIKVKEFTLDIGRKNRSGSRAYEVDYEMRKPAHDFSLVMIASGKGMSAPYWAVARPYQPSDLHFEQPVLGATNPVWIDADGDGKYSSPRAYAEQLLTNERSDESAVRKLEEFDWAARTQAAEIFAERGVDLLRLGEKSSAGVKGAFKDYLESVKN